MYLETVDLEPLIGPVFVMRGYPAPCFAFVLADDNVTEFVRQVPRMLNLTTSEPYCSQTPECFSCFFRRSFFF